MGFAVLLTLFPLVALSACPQGGGNCPAHVGRGLLQASVESTVATHVSGETAKRLLQGLHVNTTDIGIYLQSLVAKVDGHNYTLSKPEKTALETIGLMVGKMQNASVMQHAEDQQEVNRMRDLIQNCTSDAAASLAKVAAFKESASSTRKAHAACRQVEGSAKDDKTLACTTYQAHRETTTPPTCMSTELSAEYVKTDDAAKKKQMEACLVAVKSWLTPFHAKYEECKCKTDTHKNKSAECGSQQQAFEQAFCLYESKLEDTCTAQNSCRAKMIAARNSSHDGVKLAEAARKADFTSSNRLLCFLDVLRANNTHKRKTLLECQNQSKQTSKFDIVYQDIPGASDCQPELTKPCDSSWQLQEYQSQAWHSKAKMEVCKPCQAPTTTTTTTQEEATTTTTVCGSTVDVNNFSSKKAMESAGWSFTNWDSTDCCSNGSPNSWKPSSHSKDLPSTSYWGFAIGAPSLEMQLTLCGSGNITVKFGIGVQSHGSVVAFLNNVTTATVQSPGFNSALLTTFTASFTDGDVLKIGEYDTSVVVLQSVSLSMDVNDFSSKEAMEATATSSTTLMRPQ